MRQQIFKVGSRCQVWKRKVPQVYEADISRKYICDEFVDVLYL